MKQHITEEQFSELSEKASSRIEEWMESKTAKGRGYVGIGACDECGNMLTLSIGQMIEFLDEHPEQFYEHWWKRFFTWNYGEVDSYEGEFCDALWEACKEVLK